MSGRVSLLTLGLACAAASTGCATRTAPVLPAPPLLPADNAYIDLQPGWRLRVVTPILKSGGYKLKTAGPESSGNTITVSAADFVGYETAYYAIKARNGGGVRIVFVSAEVTRQGQTSAQPRPLVMLFRLPRGARYIRLIYLIRSSRADHDMAVVGAAQTDVLDGLTRHILTRPAEGCKSEPKRFCSWIPGGIAVRPEFHKVVNGVEEWLPAR